ncbi:MAG TPA: hypothetical protein ENI58_06850 [Nitrospirae bacterium]|nr:hypothetical protein [Nitrospirota bacterium]
MKIESLRLKNFKAFKDITIRDIPRMCVVVGANGAGKSTLFDVFGFLRDSLTDNVQVALSKRGGFKEVRTRDADGGIEIELKSWYFGDLAAVETGLEIDGLTAIQTKAQYCNPDNIITSFYCTEKSHKKSLSKNQRVPRYRKTFVPG